MSSCSLHKRNTLGMLRNGPYGRASRNWQQLHHVGPVPPLRHANATSNDHVIGIRLGKSAEGARRCVGQPNPSTVSTHPAPFSSTNRSDAGPAMWLDNLGETRAVVVSS